MRTALCVFVVLAGVSGCSTTAPSSDSTAQAEPAPARCSPAVLEALVGKTASQAVVDQAVRDAGAKNARVVKPGMAVTMDFREDRLTLGVDANNVIERAGCN